MLKCNKKGIFKIFPEISTTDKKRVEQNCEEIGSAICFMSKTILGFFT